MSGFTLQVMPISAGVVADVVRLRAMDRSYRQIADYLNRKRVAPPRAATWSAMTVRNIWERSQNVSNAE